MTDTNLWMLCSALIAKCICNYVFAAQLSPRREEKVVQISCECNLWDSYAFFGICPDMFIHMAHAMASCLDARILFLPFNNGTMQRKIAKVAERSDVFNFSLSRQLCGRTIFSSILHHLWMGCASTLCSWGNFCLTFGFTQSTSLSLSLAVSLSLSSLVMLSLIFCNLAHPTTRTCS